MIVLLVIFSGMLGVQLANADFSGWMLCLNTVMVIFLFILWASEE